MVDHTNIKMIMIMMNKLPSTNQRVVVLRLQGHVTVEEVAY